MGEVLGGFPLDWLDSKRPGVATDLDLAVLLVNSFDLLDDPADRLVDLTWLAAAFGRAGHAELAAELRPRDLPRLRELRDALRAAFEAADLTAAADALNPQLQAANAVFLLSITHPDDAPQSARFEVATGRHGVDALSARLPAAVAAQIAEHGLARLGTCGSDPCQCAFVDRTRAGTRRYCCSYCNDRAAARAYRRRKRS